MRLFRRRRDEDLVDEIDTHLSLLEEQYRRKGMSTEQARDAARRSFGGVLKTQQAYRAEHRWSRFDGLLQDARFGLRVLLRDRTFALTAIVVLGVGIGVNNMQFTIIYTHTMRALPISGAARMTMASFADQQGAERNLSYLEYRDLQASANLFDDLAALGPTTPVVLGDRGRAPDRYLATYTTANAFRALRIAPLIGRVFAESETLSGAPDVAMLSSEAWRDRYASDPNVVGRDVLINGEPTTVVGVIHDRAGFPSTAQVLLPMTRAPGFSPDNRDARVMRAFGRVRDGASVEEAQTQLRTLLQQTADAGGESTRRLLPNVTPISARFRGRASDPAWLAFFASGFLVVAVASANAANLMLARGMQRAREIAIRGSLGASRGRVVAQLLVESVVLAVLGGCLGFAVSLAGARLFAAGIPENSMPYWFRYSMDTTVFVVLVLISFATVLVFGLVPALQNSKPDVTGVLKDGGWSASRRSGIRWLSTGFTTAQLGMSVVLLCYVVMNAVDNRSAPLSDAVIREAPVLTASISLPANRYPTPAQRNEFWRRLDERARALPGVAGASMTNFLPRNGAVERRLDLPAKTSGDTLPSVSTVTIGPGYFDALGLPLLRGHEFGAIDAVAAQQAIVNQRFVELFLGNTDPVGKEISLAPAAPSGAAFTGTIVAVAQHIRHRDAPSEPVVYLPVATTAPPNMSVIVRSHVDAATLTTQLRQKVLELDSNLPLFQAMTLPRVIHNNEWVGRVSGRLVTTLSLIVILLSGVGLYAVTAHGVAQRGKEIGIRIAIGAQPHQIRRLVLRGASLQVALGLFFGLLFTLAWDGAFFSGRVDARFVRPEVLLPVGTVLASVMFAACLIPMWRAARLDPLTTLRRD